MTFFPEKKTARGELRAQWGATYPVKYEYDAAGRLAKMWTYRTDPTGANAATSNPENWTGGDGTEWVYHAGTMALHKKLDATTPAGQGATYTYAAKGRAGSRKLCEAFGQILAGKGLIAREGSIVDASFVDAPRQRHDREQNQRIKQGERPEEFDQNPAVGRQKDSEARWAKKHSEVHSGWKNQVKADLKTKLILASSTTASSTTAASVHDSQVFAELLDDQDQAVLADSAEHSAEHEAHLIELNAREFLMRKATRGHPLSEEEQQTHHTISRMRVRVEHIFARMAQLGADLCRSIGRQRATQQNHRSNLVYNMDRDACLAR